MDILLQWNPSVVATVGEQKFNLYRGVGVYQRLFFKVHNIQKGLNLVATIGGLPQIRGGH